MKVYLATKLFSFFDRLVSSYMFKALADTYGTTMDIYLPFRDSNMKVNQKGDVSKNIFSADVDRLKQTELFICRLDGPAFDSGIGFELGYCVARNVPVIALTTDYYDARIYDRGFIISPIINEVAYCFKYEYSPVPNMDYMAELEKNAEKFLQYFCQNIHDDLFDSRIKLPEFDDLREEFDVFLDFSGCRYEWNNILLETLTESLRGAGLRYVISRRYDEAYDFFEDVRHLLSSRFFVVCLDENEPDIDSCILQGIAFARGKAIIGYETNPRRMYLPGKQEMGANLMVEQACDEIVGNLDRIPPVLARLKEAEYEKK